MFLLQITETVKIILKEKILRRTVWKTKEKLDTLRYINVLLDRVGKIKTQWKKRDPLTQMRKMKRAGLSGENKTVSPSEQRVAASILWIY